MSDVQKVGGHQYLSEIAEESGIDRFRLWRWVRMGLIPECWKEGGRHRVPNEVAERIVRTRQPSALHGWLTLNELAELMGMSDKSFRRWRKKGLIEGKFVLGRIYFPPEEVKRILAKGVPPLKS